MVILNKQTLYVKLLTTNVENQDTSIITNNKTLSLKKSDGTEYNNITTENSLSDNLNEILNDNFSFLYSQLNKAKHEIKYLDLYHITSYYDSLGTTTSTIEALFNDLLPNESIMIGEMTSLNGINYEIGDLLLKLSNGNALKIKAPNAGLYYPQYDNGNVIWNYTDTIIDDTTVEQQFTSTWTKIVDNKTLMSNTTLAAGSYNLRFDTKDWTNSIVFYNAKVSEGTPNIISIGNTNEFSDEDASSHTYYTFQSAEALPPPLPLITSCSTTGMYGIIKNITPSMSSISVPIITVNDLNILPIVKFYNLNWEEVCCDSHINIGTSKNYVITFPSSNYIFQAVIK